MHGAEDFFFGGFKVHGEDQLGEEFGDVFADHVSAEQLAVFRVEDEFDEAFGFTGGQCAAAGAEGEFTDFDLAVFGSQFLFGSTHGGDLGVRIGAGGDVAIINGMGVQATDALDAIDRFVVGDVGEIGVAIAGHRIALRPIEGDAVADGVNVFEIGAKIGGGFDAVLEDFELAAGGEEFVSVAGDADGDKAGVGFDGAGLGAGEG
jgi:hypothetical protein